MADWRSRIRRGFMRFYLKVDDIATVITYLLAIPVLILSFLFPDVLEVLRHELLFVSWTYGLFLGITAPVFLLGRWVTHHRSKGDGLVVFYCWVCGESMSANYHGEDRPAGICQNCEVRMVERSFKPMRFRDYSLPEIDPDTVQDDS